MGNLFSTFWSKVDLISYIINYRPDEHCESLELGDGVDVSHVESVAQGDEGNMGTVKNDEQDCHGTNDSSTTTGNIEHSEEQEHISMDNKGLSSLEAGGITGLGSYGEQNVMANEGETSVDKKNITGCSAEKGTGKVCPKNHEGAPGPSTVNDQGNTRTPYAPNSKDELGNRKRLGTSRDVVSDGAIGESEDGNLNRQGIPVPSRNCTFEINIQNSGSVIIGDNMTISIGEKNALHMIDEENNLQLVDVSSKKLPEKNSSEMAKSVQKRKPPGKKGKSSMAKKYQVEPALIRKQTLSEYRENGNWEDHDEVDSLIERFRSDEDNKDKFFFLSYEKAAGFYLRNNLGSALKLACEVGKEMEKHRKEMEKHREEMRKQGKVMEKHFGDAQNWIYVKVLILVSDIRRRQGNNLGRVEKALRDAEMFMKNTFTHPLLEAEYHLAHARYELRFGNRQRLTCIEERLDEAEKVVSVLKKKDPKQWKKMKREILLMRLDTILKSVIDGNVSDRLPTLFDELESQFSDGISKIAQVQFQTLKCDYLKYQGNISQALIYANNGLEISKKCGFKAEEDALKDRINSMEDKQLPSIARSDQLVNGFLHMTTTDSGNLESNAQQESSDGTFSVDEMDLGTFDDIPNLSSPALKPAEGRIESRETISQHGECSNTSATGNGERNHFVKKKVYKNVPQLQQVETDGHENASLNKTLEENSDLGTSNTGGTVNVPDAERFTEREQTRLSQRLASNWDNVAGLLNMDRETRDNIEMDNVHFPDLQSKAKEVLRQYNNSKDFSRRELADLVEEDLRRPEVAENILSAKWKY